MSRKLIVIIVGLFLVQIGVYTLIYFDNKPEEIIRHEISGELKIDLLRDFPDYKTREVLYLDGLDLTSVPNEILQFQNLKQLHLSNNELLSFPYEVLQLPQLEQLHLNNNNIQYIQTNNSQSVAKRLEVLEVAENQLHTVDGLWNFPNLKQLNLSNNGLEFIEMQNPKLAHIDLSHNYFRAIPFLKFTNGDFIKLSDNRIEQVSFDNIPKTTTTLEIQNNEIEKIFTASYFSEFNIEALDLSNNKLALFPNKLLELQKLKKLKLNNNLIALWFSSVETPINESLEEIDLSSNEFVVLLVDLNELVPNLQKLSLSKNKLVSVNFRHDNLSFFRLEDNPNAQCALSFPKLHTMYCDYEHLETGENKIIAPNLEELQLYNTQKGLLLSDTTRNRYPNVNVFYQ